MRIFFLAATIACAVFAVAVVVYLGIGSGSSEISDVDSSSESGNVTGFETEHRSVAPGEDSALCVPDPDKASDREPLLKSWLLAEKTLYEGSVISGVVLDRRTGEAPGERPGFGDSPAFNVWEVFSPDTAPQRLGISDMRYEEGLFTIPIASLNPPPVGGDARYTVTCETRRYVSAFVENLTLSPEQGAEGVRFELEELGRLHLTGEGYEGNGSETFQFSYSCRTRPVEEVYWKRIWGSPVHRKDVTPWIGGTSRPGAALRKSGGKLDHTLTLEPGLWQIDISLCDDDAGYSVVIESGRTTELVVNRSDLGPPFTVLGRVTDSDGNPVAGVKLRFDGRGKLDGMVKPAHYRTDGRGEFAPLALVPGLWEVTAWSESGELLSFPCVPIPDRPTDPYLLELVVEEGSVSGRLCDRIAGRPFGDDYTRWFLLLRDVDRGTVVAEKFNHFGGAFHIASAPAGLLRLEIRARGFVDFVSEPFRHDGKRDIDLGAVQIERLNSSGSAIVSVVGEDGAPFADRVSIEVLRPLGREGAFETLPYGDKGYGWAFLGGNSFRLDRLPAQEVTISVTSVKKGKSARPVRQNVTIEAGCVSQVTVAMSPSH